MTQTTPTGELNVTPPAKKTVINACRPARNVETTRGEKRPRKPEKPGQRLGQADGSAGRANQNRECQSHDQAYLLAIGK